MIRLTSVVAAAALVLGVSAAGAPRWELPVQLSTGERALGPELALNASGDGVVVWDQEVGSECASSPASLNCIHIVTAVSRDRGSTAWSTPTEISRPGVGAAPRAAIDPAGNAALLWIHDIGRDRVVQASYRRGTSGSWPEPNDISEASLEVRSHEIALDAAGNAVAVWAERRDQSFDVYAAVRPAAAGGWRAATLLSGQTQAVSGPDLAIAANGRAEVAWIDAGNNLRVVSGEAASGAWGALATPAGADGAAKRNPRIATNEAGDVAVFWLTGDPSSANRIWHALKPGTAAWRQAQTLAVAWPGAVAPSVVVDSKGDFHVAWLGPRGVLAQTAPVAAEMSAWGPAALVSRGAASDPQLALDATGNAVAVWTVGGGSAAQAAIEPGAAGWQPQTSIAPPDAFRLRVGMFSRGRAVVTFGRGDPLRLTIGSADLVGDGPVLTQLRTPGGLVVGARGRFSVQPAPWAAPLAGSARWDFGDGTGATGASVRHAYSRAGRYAVTVSQTDAAGARSSETVDVLVVRSRVRNRTRPWIRGVPRVGRRLTCMPGTWSGSPPIWFVYGWRRDGRPLSADHQRYRLTHGDAGSLVACHVEARNPAGAAHRTSAVVAVES